MNKSLRQYYEKIGTTFGLEDTAFDRGVENSYGLYGDVAIVVLSRGGGEGSDMPTVTGEEADEKDLASILATSHRRTAKSTSISCS